ncbi:MAG: RHS repeat domain-containing protein [bacterium]
MWVKISPSGERGGEGAVRSVGSTTHYNAFGQVASTMDVASNTTTYAYDGQGRRTQVTDALSNTT